MASDRPAESPENASGESPINPEKALSSRRTDVKLENKAETHLRDSLDTDDPAVKDFHTRQALQALQIVTG